MFGFNAKKQQHLGDTCAEAPKPVKCDECKHYVDREDAQTVEVLTMFRREQWTFCPMHKREYDRVDSRDGKKARYMRFVPAHYEEVGEKGKKK